MKLPEIPVAAENLEALLRLGHPWWIRDSYKAVVIVTGDVSDPVMVWASPDLTSYRSVWERADEFGFVDSADAWGANMDIDHVFPKSWGVALGLSYVRLFPVYREVNRSAGGGIEKHVLSHGISKISNKRKNGVIFANELQVLKILGHPVGTVRDPVIIFGAKNRRSI